MGEAVMSGRRLYEDSERYCVLWLGIVIMTSYFMEFLFKTSVGFLTIDPGNLFWLFLFPVPMTFFFYRYFVPERGKTKNLMLSLGTFAALMYIIMSFVVYPWVIADVIWYASWGIGSAVMTAGGAAMISLTTDDEAYTAGMLDYSKMHYGPEHKPEPKPVPEDESPEADSEDKKENEEIPVVSAETAE